MRRKKHLPVLIFLIVWITLLAGCNQAVQENRPTLSPTQEISLALVPTQTNIAASPTVKSVDNQPVAQAQAVTTELSATPAVEPGSTPTTASTSTPDTRKLPKYWAEWPLVPQVSARTIEIYRLGQALGNDAHSFSTIGDCQSVPSVFMGTYDSDSYLLGEGYEYLDETVKHFRGSFKRDSVSVKDGMSVASVLSPMWADPKQCQQNETPLDCELRLHKPIIMFINLGTNWNGGDEVTHEKYMRQVVDKLLEHGVIPILASKGDNLEGGHRINQSIARVAYDYDIPFWNFWLSIRDLPGKGIDGSREGGYLTPEAWGRRSFTGLMALAAVWNEVNR